MCPILSKSALVQVLAWRQTGEKPLPEPMLSKIPDVTTPQGVDFCAEFSPDLSRSLRQMFQYALHLYFPVPPRLSSAAIRGPLCQHPGGRARVYPGPTYGHS